MKIMKTTLLALSIICLAASHTAYAQDYVAPPVTISQDKVKMDGKLYYSHVVLEKQTLYSISKAYGVSMDDIYEANPSLKETGLKKNAIILIPVPETGAMAEGQEIRDKAAGRKAAKEEKRQNRKNRKDYFIHTVKWYEDLDVISGKYGVPVDIIMEVNGLKDRKLKKRQQLRIPTDLQAYMDSLKPEKVETSPADSVSAPAVPGKFSSSLFRPDAQVNALLMLPFNAQGEEPSRISMDFYCGVLLAAKDIGEEGVNVDLSVYDTYGDVLPVTKERLGKSDFVIGPPSVKGLTGLLEMSPEETYVISPLDTRTAYLTTEHGNFIQVPTSTMLQYEDLLKWIEEDCQKTDSTIIIYEKGIRDLRKETEFRTILDRSRIRHSSFSYSILEGRDILDSLCTKMTADGVNRVLVASESEAFINDVIRNLNLLIHNKFNIVLYGASKIRSYETVDVSNLHNANLHTSMPYYIEYDDPKVRDFLMKYRALYNTEPSQMAFQGYDIMYYFTTMFSRDEDDRQENMTEDTPMLMSDFRFVRSGKGLARNVLRRVVYAPDYSVKVIRPTVPSRD